MSMTLFFGYVLKSDAGKFPEKLRVVWVGFKDVLEALNQAFDRSTGGEHLILPNLVQDGVAIQYLVGVFDKQEQEA